MSVFLLFSCFVNLIVHKTAKFCRIFLKQDFSATIKKVCFGQSTVKSLNQ